MKNFIEQLERAKHPNELASSYPYYKGYNEGLDTATRIYIELRPQTETIAPEPKKPLTEAKFKAGDRVVLTTVDKLTGEGSSYELMCKLEIGKEYRVAEVNKDNSSCFFNWIGLSGMPEGDNCWFNPEKFRLKSDCEIIPETTVIPFDYQRWKDGDYVRVVTRDGREVKQLTHFNLDVEYPLSGVEGDTIRRWGINGSWIISDETPSDLHLEIAKPKAKEYFVNVYEFKDGRKYFEGVGDMERVPFKYNDRTFFKTIKFEL